MTTNERNNKQTDADMDDISDEVGKSLCPRQQFSEPSTTSSTTPLTVIQPQHGWLSLQFAELWHYRELLFFLAWRDIKVRYKQTVIGAAWAVIQPLMTMIVFTIIFSKLANIPSDGVPYPLFSFAALVPWGLFVFGLGSAADSVVGSANLIKKVYFPRLIIPISTVLAGLVDFAIALCVLLILIVIYGRLPTLNIVWLPFFVALTIMTALGVGLWLSALNVQFRDIRHVLPFLTQFWLLITPISYPASLIKDQSLRAIYSLNPMVGVVEGFRWALLGSGSAPGITVWISVFAALFLLISGAYYFRRMEHSFADVV